MFLLLRMLSRNLPSRNQLPVPHQPQGRHQPQSRPQCKAHLRQGKQQLLLPPNQHPLLLLKQLPLLHQKPPHHPQPLRRCHHLLPLLPLRLLRKAGITKDTMIKEVMIRATTKEAMIKEAMTREATTKEAIKEAMTKEAMIKEVMTKEVMTKAMIKEATTKVAMTKEHRAMASAVPSMTTLERTIPIWFSTKEISSLSSMTPIPLAGGKASLTGLLATSPATLFRRFK